MISLIGLIIKLCYDFSMKIDTELDNLLVEYQNVINLKEDSMLLDMFDRNGNISKDRDTVIQSLKNRIVVLKEKEQVVKALNIVKGVKKGSIKVYPIDTLWDEI